MIRAFHALGRSGNAVIEFALIAPFLMTLLLGVVDLVPIMMVKFKVGTATQAVADLSAQTATMTASDISNDFAIGSDLMAPFSGSSLVLRITNVASDGNGRAFVYWSCGQGTLAPFNARSSVGSSPNGMLTLTQIGRNTSYVMVESQHTFTPLAGLILRGPQTTAVTSYTLPRVSTYIGPTTGDPNYVPAPPTSANSTFTFSLGNVTCNVSY